MREWGRKRGEGDLSGGGLDYDQICNAWMSLVLIAHGYFDFRMGFSAVCVHLFDRACGLGTERSVIY